MKIRIYGVVENGENKRDIKKQLEEKFMFMPVLSDCESANQKETHEGKCSEFVIDADVLIRRMKLTIEKKVAEEVAELVEAYKAKLKEEIIPLEAL